MIVVHAERDTTRVHYEEEYKKRITPSASWGVGGGERKSKKNSITRRNRRMPRFTSPSGEKRRYYNIIYTRAIYTHLHP